MDHLALGNWINIGALVAVFLFMLREIIEGRRRTKATKKKRLAVVQILIDACEYNRECQAMWIDTLALISPQADSRTKIELSGGISSSFKLILRDGFNHYPLIVTFKKFENETFDKLLLEISSFDVGLFEKCIKVIRAINAINDDIESVIFEINHRDERHAGRLPAYARDFLKTEEKNYAIIEDLYFELTSQKLGRRDLPSSLRVKYLGKLAV